MKNGLERNLGLFLAGAFLGGTAIALTTPWPGRRARRWIGRRVDRGTRDAQRAARQLQDSGRRAYALGSELLHQAGKVVSRTAAAGR